MEAPVYHLENVVHVRSELENFDGPLDLILTLLSRNRMEIQDIQISLILDQYLQWMEEQKELNLDVASEFVAMASHLVFIKTKVLLAMDQEESVSEMEELVAALEERKRSENYARVKLLLPELKRRYEIGSDCLTRGPLPVTPDKTYRYHHAPEDLTRAMKALYQRSAEEVVPPERAFRGIVGREPYPVGKKAEELLRRVGQGVQRLKSLFRLAKSRSELVATFLAVLELCKLHRIQLEGTGEEETVSAASGGQGSALDPLREGL
jgi:segregation and condensation protein A